MPHNRGPVLRILLNPIVVSLVVVAMIGTGWLLYTGGGASIAQARTGANLLPALQPATEGTALNGPVSGWNISHSGDAQASLELVDGGLNEHGLKLEVAQYVSGDITLTSPRIDVKPGKSYLFKAFTTTDADFTLLARRHHADGSTTLEQLPNPVQRPGNSLFTVSDAFHTAETTSAVEYVFRLNSKGIVRLEGAYLEATDDVRLPPVAAAAPNLVPNPELAGSQPGALEAWSPYDSGTSTVGSGLGEDESGRFLWTRIENYQSGEAKWQYETVPVGAYQYFTFQATYRAEREVDVVAEFELVDGGRVFRNLATVSPAGEWTTITEAFQVPQGAKTAMVTLVSHGNGTTDVRDYSLSEATKPGPVRWDRPMVSITFDDGWQTVYDRALPLLDKHNFPSTQYVNASTIETPNFMTGAQLRQMHGAGHEIAAHGYEHVDLTSIGTDRLNEDLRKNKEALAGAGLNTNNLAFPFGRSDPQVDWYASKYYDVLRGTDEGINTRQNLDPHDLKVYYVTDETTPDHLADALAETSRVNGWLILVYHQIVGAEPSSTQKPAIAVDRSTITSDALAVQLQRIAESGIEVQSVAQAIKQLQDQ